MIEVGNRRYLLMFGINWWEAYENWIVGTIIATRPEAEAASGNFGNSNGVPRGGQGRGGAIRRLLGDGGVSGGHGFGRGRGRGRGELNEEISAEGLDADSDKYYSEASEAMQTS